MNNKTVRERANDIERSLSTETQPKRRSNTGFPSYSRSTTSSAKRASLSNVVGNNNRVKRLRKEELPSRESSPTLSETSLLSHQNEEEILCIALEAKLLQYQHLNWETEKQFRISETIAENELGKARDILQDLKFQEIQQNEEENSQNILDEICRKIVKCMDRIDVITREDEGDLDVEKEKLIFILNQLNDIKIPTFQVHTNIKSLMECRRLIQNIIESIQ